jgi:hypothetical protein
LAVLVCAVRSVAGMTNEVVDVATLTPRQRSKKDGRTFRTNLEQSRTFD